MYLGGVNRGVSFTKAGFYATGLVIVLGFFATASGYNGLFLALGFGLSFLAVSGLLSEKTIRATQFNGLSDVLAEADSPFSISLRVSNESETWSVFGLENLVTAELPRFKLLQTQVPYLMEARLLTLAPLQTISVSGQCRGLPRGWHRNFFIIQRTLFPFGLISKFKVGRFSANVLILPKRDPSLEGLLSYEIRQRLGGISQEQEFHSHRRMTPHSPLHTLDWKKNASLPVDDWVMKVYESPATEFGFWIDPNWNEIIMSDTEEAYEKSLSVIRTACDVISRTGKPFLLKTGQGGFVFGREASQLLLVKVPQFDLRSQIPAGREGEAPRPGWYLRLRLSRERHTWDKNAVQLS